MEKIEISGHVSLDSGTGQLTQRTSMRPPGVLHVALGRLPRSAWTGQSPELARAWLQCPRVRAMTMRHAFAYSCDADDLMMNMWLILTEKLLANLDEPANVYSLVFATAENCARTLRNAQREVLLDDGDDEDHSDAVSRIPDEATIASPATGNHVEISLDQESAKRALAEKIKRLGWPQAIPRSDSRYRRAGRPLGSRNKIDPYNSRKSSGDSTMKTQLSPYLTTEKPRFIDEAHSIEIEREMADAKTSPDPAVRELQPTARELLEIRLELGMTNRSFAQALEASTAVVSALLSGNVYRHEQAQGLLARAQALRAQLLKKRDTAFLITNDMQTIVQNWRKRLRLKSSPEKAAREIAVLCTANMPEGQAVSESTMYRWWQQNRKPVDLETLVSIHRVVLQLEKQGTSSGKARGG
ncbi:hypothetical protein [Caballeronia sordidicola]|uniref:hypothetical protein n=1 Tax=Caballeronia sordidicola TaxID=196367 RepID=UPI0004D00C09|nr:hypothetical protein [Caballeronia sordidicola]